MAPVDQVGGFMAVEQVNGLLAVEQAVGLLAVEVVYCPAPHRVDLVPLTLPAGATVADALHASGVLERHALQPAGLSLGLWGRPCTPEQPLRERDRVEILRPLQVDPKEARRQRYKGKARRPAGP